jgi:hypothetical protein
LKRWLGGNRLNEAEFKYIYRHAYLPEHLPFYVEAISDTSAHLIGDYICFTRRNHLIFNGYPLGNKTSDVKNAYETACQRFRPNTVAIIAPEIWLPNGTFEAQPKDSYYRLDLPIEALASEVAYMVRRAGRTLRVRQGTFGKEHRKLIKAFLSTHELSPQQKNVFKKIPHYLKRSKTACLLEARKENVLAAFTIVEMGSASFAFYLFNFRSDSVYVPGASDLLFHEMVKLVISEGKSVINLGLGINPGIRRFKEKWGGVHFLPYASTITQRDILALGKLANKL